MRLFKSKKGQVVAAAAAVPILVITAGIVFATLTGIPIMYQLFVHGKVILYIFAITLAGFVFLRIMRR